MSDLLILAWPLFIKGLGITCLLMISGSLVSLVLGLALALCRTGWLLGRFPLFKWLAIGWIDLFRNTPLLCQVLFFFYGLHLGGFLSALLGLCTYTSAYISEVFRAGFRTVPADELTEARLLGLSRLQTIRQILLPRSLEAAAPSLGQQVMNLTKNTAIAYFVAVGDLTSVFEFTTSQTYHFYEFFVITLLCYGSLCLGINWLFTRLEKRLLKRFQPCLAPLPAEFSACS